MKNFKALLIKKLLKWAKILDIEKALRDKYHEGIEATEKKYAGKINVWWDPTVRSYPQQAPKSAPLHLPTGTLARGWHGMEVTGVHPTITGVLKRIKIERNNTEPIDMEKDFPAFLNDRPIAVEHMTPAEIERVPTIRDLTEPFDEDNTEEVPAILKLIYQDRQQRRNAG